MRFLGLSRRIHLFQPRARESLHVLVRSAQFRPQCPRIPLGFRARDVLFDDLQRRQAVCGCPARALSAGEGGGAKVDVGKRKQATGFLPGQAKPAQIYFARARDLAEKFHRRGELAGVVLQSGHAGEPKTTRKAAVAHPHQPVDNSPHPSHQPRAQPAACG